MRFNKQGFTLIELLVVIAILAVLMGIVIVVINPAQIRIRSNQSVCKSSVARVCEASMACYAAMADAAKCDTVAKIGVDLPTTPCAVAIAATTGVVTATQDLCTFTCNPATGMADPSGTCYVD